jgi:predicted ATPase
MLNHRADFTLLATALDVGLRHAFNDVVISTENHNCRIVLTGGPGGGKSTAADLFCREIGDRVTLVPEAATMLFSGGFPRGFVPAAVLAAQKAIYHVQRNLEAVQAALFPGRVLLCDRGTIDGAAYWPGEVHHFFETVGSSFERELARYDAVVFFETAAVGRLGIEGGNPVRCESIDQAIELDQRLRKLWSKHPRFVVVPHNVSFFKKISFGLAVIDGLVSELAEKKKAAKPARKRKR